MNKAERMRERLRYERIGVLFEPKRWSAVRVVGINPYAIDRVEGVYSHEFHPRTGKSLPLNECKEIPVVAWDLRHPDGRSERFATLREARAKAAMLAAERRK
jgi:hypothetical protein